MNITSLTLHNFRNFWQSPEIGLPRGALLVAAAPNATGKTNFLESLVVLLRGKSWRGATEDCVRWGQESFTVRGEVEHGGIQSQLAVRYHQPTKKLRIEEDGSPASPITFFSHYPFVLFLPEDSFLFAGGPALRRNFLNQTLVCSPAYVSALVQYQRALRQRNAALKSARSYESVAPWTEALVNHGTALWQARQAFTEYIAAHLATVYEQITREKLKLEVRLELSLESPEQFTEILEQDFSSESRFGYTLTGPHRDDLMVLLGQRTLGTAVSQGQMRGITIALKLVAWRYLKSVTKEVPLLLLDEVLSEFDDERRDALLTHLPEGQTLLTCTTVPEVLRRADNAHLLDLSSLVSDRAVSTKPGQNEKTRVAQSDEKESWSGEKRVETFREAATAT